MGNNFLSHDLTPVREVVESRHATIRDAHREALLALCARGTSAIERERLALEAEECFRELEALRTIDARIDHLDSLLRMQEVVAFAHTLQDSEFLARLAGIPLDAWRTAISEVLS